MTELLAFDQVSKRFGKKLDVFEKIARVFGSKVQEQIVHAVDNDSLTINQGEVVGLVGESGCGKSTLGRLGCGLIHPLRALCAIAASPSKARAVYGVQYNSFFRILLHP